MASLLVIACSQKKRSDAELLPALERYDGPAFRVLRKSQREGGLNGLTILVLSARFGLIPASQPIANYDQAMTAARAEEIRPGVERAFENVVRTIGIQRVGLCLGKHYAGAFDNLAEVLPPGIAVTRLSGGLGKRLTALKAWLNCVAREACL